MADSDNVRPEHAVEMFRLLGGGVVGDLSGLPNVQLAVLPGTTHITLIGANRAAVRSSRRFSTRHARGEVRCCPSRQPLSTPGRGAGVRQVDKTLRRRCCR